MWDLDPAQNPDFLRVFNDNFRSQSLNAETAPEAGRGGNGSEAAQGGAMQEPGQGWNACANGGVAGLGDIRRWVMEALGIPATNEVAYNKARGIQGYYTPQFDAGLRAAQAT